MKLKEYKFKITGTLPLLTHNPSVMRGASDEVKRKKIPSPEEEARAGLYEVDGAFCLPSVAFRSCLLNGLKGKKIGKVGAATVFKAAVFNADEWTTILWTDASAPHLAWTIDSRRAVIQRNGVIRSRPRFEQWAAVVSLQIDEDIISAEQVAEHLDTAGTVCGVGDFRIEKGGQFGSFRAELIE